MNDIFNTQFVLIDKESLLIDLFKYLKSIQQNNDLIFRGATNKDYKLLPSLYRFNLEDYDAVSKEYLFENGLFEGLEQYIKNRRLEFYQTLQHYGIKTKLLDFTKDPFIGLLFAVCDWPLSNDNSAYDGELIIIYKANYHFIEADDFELFGDLLFEEREGIISEELDDLYGNSKASFSTEIRFLDGIKTANNRINRQKGCFLLFPNLSEDIREIDKNLVFKRIIIKSQLKSKIIKMLKEEENLSMYLLF